MPIVRIDGLNKRGGGGGGNYDITDCLYYRDKTKYKQFVNHEYQPVEI